MADSRVVFITGGGRGIGAATAKYFAAKGDKVVITSRTVEQLEATAEEIKSQGGDVLPLPGDIGDDDRVAEIVEKTVEHFGRIDVLINNAVISGAADIFTLPPQKFRELINVNLIGYYTCAHYCVPHMVQGGGGVIVNISSIMGWMTAGIGVAYATAKGGIEAMTCDLAVRLGPEKVRVVCLRLGAIATEISASWAGGDDNLKDIGAHFMDLCPIERQASAEETARVIHFLASDDAAYIHGSTLTMDGGRTVAMYPKSLASRIPR
jgi:NAD(P)-dependent dehydrogenase (short-subunit alcohol dehydrogenase family)